MAGVAPTMGTWGGPVDDFDYLLVLLSIACGIALTQLLAGLGKLIRARVHERVHWPSLVWAMTFLAVIVQGRVADPAAYPARSTA